MSIQQIRRGNTLVGNLNETPTQIQARNLQGQLKGWYDKTCDQTRKADGSFFGNGNQVTALL